jgi:hydroxymethylglutaryl-CoA reductase
MGMNMVSKGVQSVLDYLQNEFPDMETLSISGKELKSIISHGYEQSISFL